MNEDARDHAELEVLPDWPRRTIAILATVEGRPYAIPVTAPARAGDHLVLITLNRSRGSLARIRADDRVALMIITEGNIALTAHGRARILEEPLAEDDEYAAIAIDVERIDDHRQPGFVVESSIGRGWVDDDAKARQGRLGKALDRLAADL